MNSEVGHDFHPWQPSACLRVSGADAATFLQGQFTNDLQRIGATAAVYGLWLNQKGKVLADSFVVPVGAGEFLVVSYYSAAKEIRERLEAYVIADDVVIEDVTSSMRGLTLFGVAAPEVPARSRASVFLGRRGGETAVEMVFPASLEAEVRAGLALGRELSAAEMESRRIKAGIPAVPQDIGPAELPNEGGLEAVAISYTKGCYLGQEVMARLKSMGQVRRRLGCVQGTGPAPTRGTALFQQARKVGELRSVAADGSGWFGLALISLLNLAPEAGLSTAPDGPGSVTVTFPA